MRGRRAELRPRRAGTGEGWGRGLREAPRTPHPPARPAQTSQQLSAAEGPPPAAARPFLSLSRPQRGRRFLCTPQLFTLLPAAGLPLPWASMQNQEHQGTPAGRGGSASFPAGALSMSGHLQFRTRSRSHRGGRGARTKPRGRCCICRTPELAEGSCWVTQPPCVRKKPLPLAWWHVPRRGNGLQPLSALLRSVMSHWLL